MSKNMHGLILLATGIIVGAILGAGASLLAAPQSGEQTRTQIRTRGLQIKTQADQTIQHTRTQAEALVARARDRMEERMRRSSSPNNATAEAGNIMVEQ